MRHDSYCELARPRMFGCPQCEATGLHCHCGSRAFPLCVPCRRGEHRNHTAVDPNTGERCACDLEEAS